MIKRSLSAGTRALCVAGVLVAPALLMNPAGGDTIQIALFVALLAAALVFVEYVSAYPSVIDFRSAPPFNRIRFIGFSICIFALTQLVSGFVSGEPGPIYTVAKYCAMVLDIPFSPVRLLTLVPTPEDVEVVRMASALAYFMGLATVAVLVLVTRLLDWPLNKGDFNVLTNMPLFDPTSGGDVLVRMRRDAQFYLSLGFLLPFIAPALMRVAVPVLELLSLSDPQALIWLVAAWAFIPASFAMRGIALLRVAGLIEEKRRRTYALQDEDGLQIA